MKKNSKITQITIEGVPSRVPTGAIQFNNDWPGLFVRGDTAFALMLELKQILQTLEEQGNRDCHTHLVRSVVNIIEADVIVRHDSRK